MEEQEEVQELQLPPMRDSPPSKVVAEPMPRYPPDEEPCSSNSFPTDSKRLAERLKQLTTPLPKYDMKINHLKNDVPLKIPPESKSLLLIHTVL